MASFWTWDFKSIKLLFLLLITVGVVVSNKYNDTNVTVRKKRAINSFPVDVVEYPSVVSILYRNKNEWHHNCGGTIISRFHILTACHCFDENQNPKMFAVRAGSSYWDKDGSIHYVSTFACDPRRNITNYTAFDIAVVMVSMPFTLGPAIKKVEIATSYNQIWLNKNITTAGWGINEFLTNSSVPNQPIRYNGSINKPGWKRYGEFYPEQMRSIVSQIVDLKYCKTTRYDSFGVPIAQNMICTRGYEGELCAGDSGSGIILDEKLIGVDSHIPDGKNRISNCYGFSNEADVVESADWILDFVKSSTALITQDINVDVSEAVAKFTQYEIRDIITAPHIVAILHNDWLLCTGSIVSESYVVSTAYCLKKHSEHELSVRAGSSSWNARGSLHNVSKIILHPNANFFEGTPMYDVAILKIIGTFSLTHNTRRPIKLHTTRSFYDVYTPNMHAWVSGWGNYDLINYNETIKLRVFQPQLQIYNVTVKNAYVYNISHTTTTDQVSDIISQYDVLSVESSMSFNSWNKSSGSSLVVNGKLAGILSNKRINNIQDYVDISAVSDWIDSIINNRDAKIQILPFIKSISKDKKKVLRVNSIDNKKKSLVNDEFVVNNVEASIENFPHTVSLLKDGNFICTGSIISPFHVVVIAIYLAMEIKPFDLSRYTIRAGSNYWNEGGSLHNVISYSFNPRFDPRPNSRALIRGFDLAVITVNTPFELESKAQRAVKFVEPELHLRNKQHSLELRKGKLVSAGRKISTNTTLSCDPNKLCSERMQSLTFRQVDSITCSHTINRFLDEIKVPRIRQTDSPSFECAKLTNGTLDGSYLGSGIVLDGKLAYTLAYITDYNMGLLIDVTGSMDWIIDFVNSSSKTIKQALQRNEQSVKLNKTEAASMVNNHLNHMYYAPHAVAIAHRDWHICTGSIISKSHVVSTAFCLKNYPPLELTVRAGSVYWNTGGSLHHVDKVTSHPKAGLFNGIPIYDVAVLKIVDTFNFDYITESPIKLHTPISFEQFYEPDATYWVFGWENYDLINVNMTTVMLPKMLWERFNVTIKSNEQCPSTNEAYEVSSISSQYRVLCTDANLLIINWEERSYSSGSGVVVNGRLAGILSYTYGQSGGKTQEFVSVTNVGSWIESVVN